MRKLLAACALAYALLVIPGMARLGAQYEEVVPYVDVPLDVVAGPGLRRADEGGPRWVVSSAMPRLAVQIGSHRFALLNQVYMTNHLSFVGLAIGRLTGQPLWGPRCFHALFGIALILLVYELGCSLYDRRAALLAAALSATSFNVVFMFTWARFDESLPSLAPLAALCALLRFRRDGRARWLYAAAIAVGLGVSAKITTLWLLGAIGLAGWIAGRRPRISASQLAVSAGLVVPWLVPMIAHALLAPGAPASSEMGRRLGFLGDLVTTDVVPRTLANLVDYLGSWESLAGEIARGAGGSSWAGRTIVLATLAWLVWAALRKGATPRRMRPETALLVVIAVIVTLVALFYREHQDYQLVLLVPLFSLGVAGALVALAGALGRALPARVGLVLVALVPIAIQLRDHVRWWDDLDHAQNAMMDQKVQRESALFLDRAGIRPITTTFYSVGVYELLTAGRVRPLHASNLFRRDRGKPSPKELVATWRRLLAVGCDQPRYVLLPLGTNPVEARHFDEPAIRAALLAGAPTRIQTFGNLLELYRVDGCSEPIEEPPPSTVAALGGMTAGTRIGALTISEVTEPIGGAILLHTVEGVTFEVRLAGGQPPPALAGAYAVYFRAPADAALQAAAASRIIAARIIADRMPPGLTPLR